MISYKFTRDVMPDFLLDLSSLNIVDRATVDPMNKVCDVIEISQMPRCTFYMSQFLFIFRFQTTNF